MKTSTLANTSKQFPKIKRQLPFLDLDTVIPTRITDTLYQKIRHLCNTINKVEWSGAIFYEMKGSLSTPSELELIVHDLIPLDKGTTGFTSYEFDERILNYGLEKGYLEKDYKIGHIHSHHSMQTFFSGTDNEEVNENSEFQNPYLSIIVNNKGDYSAKIAFRGQAISKSISYTYLDVDGSTRQKKVEREQEVVITYPCKCIDPICTDEMFIKQLKEICKSKPHSYKSGNNKGYGMNFQTPLFDDEDPYGLDDWNQDDPIDYPDLKSNDIVEDFFPFVLMNGSIGVSHSMTFDRSITLIGQMIKKQEFDIRSYVEQVYNNFPVLVQEFYGEESDEYDTAISLLELLVEQLEQYGNKTSDKIYSEFVKHM